MSTLPPESDGLSSLHREWRWHLLGLVAGLLIAAACRRESPPAAVASATTPVATANASPTAKADTPIAADGSSPALNWVLPIFTDKEGHRSMTLRGSEVRPLDNGVRVTDLSITIFAGGETPVVDSMLLSPVARFFPKQNLAAGEGPVRFIRDDIEVTGVDWVYDHAAKKISLRKEVRVVFSAQLKDILK